MRRIYKVYALVTGSLLIFVQQKHPGSVKVSSEFDNYGVPLTASRTNLNITAKSQKAVCDALASKWNMKNHQELDETACNEFKKFCGIKTCLSMIDVVYLWVNGSDPLFQEKHLATVNQQRQSCKASAKLDISSDSKNRYRDLGQFRYSLRSLEKNMPWARRIFIVTNDQVPVWLQVEHPQIRIINHSQLTPKPTMPLFNSMAIQSMVHTIPTISSPFMYTEDDFYFGSPVKLEYLWITSEKRANVYTTQRIHRNSRVPTVFEISVMKSYEMAKSKGQNVERFHDKQADYLIYNGHAQMMIYPEKMQELWDLFLDTMLAMSSHSFRTQLDPHIWSLYVFMQSSQIATRFDTADRTRFYMLREDCYRGVFEAMIEDPRPFMCINDDFVYDPSFSIMRDIKKTYETLFPLASSFERI